MLFIVTVAGWFIWKRTNNEEKESQQMEVIMFHNGTGPMCLDAIEFFESNDIKYTEHLTSDPDFSVQLEIYMAKFNGESEGFSGDFGYYPMIFAGDRAFSGFDDVVERDLMEILKLN